MTLPEIVYDLKLIMHSGRIPDDTKIDNRLIIAWVNNQRAVWLKNEYNKGRDISNNELQTLYEVELEPVDVAELQGLSTGQMVLRTKQKLPRTIQVQIRDLFYIKPLSAWAEKINYIQREQVPFAGNGILNRHMIFAWKDNDYVYIKRGNQNYKTDIPTKVRVQGVFENPLEAENFNGTDYMYDGKDSNDNIIEYPISRHFVDYMKDQILKLDVQTFYTMPVDAQNDDEAETVTHTK